MNITKALEQCDYYIASTNRIKETLLELPADIPGAVLVSMDTLHLGFDDAAQWYKWR